MKEVISFILSITIGFSMITLSLSIYNNRESAQKIENIERLYQLKTSLENNKNVLETETYIKETQRLIDSIENDKSK